MSDAALFVFGLVATLFAVGPLSVALILELREKRRAGDHPQGNGR